MDLEEIEKILKLLREHDVRDFELQREGMTLKLSRGGHLEVAPQQVVRQVQIEPAVPSVFQNGQTSAAAPISQTASVPVPVIDPNLVKVESPIVGTFYRKPSPDADPFVKEGSRVTKGDTLCIIEAMKLMNEIEAPAGGVVEKVMLGDGEVVEFGEVLFLINPNA